MNAHILKTKGVLLKVPEWVHPTLACMAITTLQHSLVMEDLISSTMSRLVCSILLVVCVLCNVHFILWWCLVAKQGQTNTSKCLSFLARWSAMGQHGAWACNADNHGVVYRCPHM